jgi:SNF2 family DNA or RNA helicase
MPTQLHAALADQGLVVWVQGLNASSLAALAREHLGIPGTERWQGTQVAIGGRSIRALAFDGRNAIGFLAACAGREMIGAEVAASEDLTYWCRALRLAAEIVAAARFLPGLRYDSLERAHRAVWEPVLGERERVLAAALISEMPDACRALSTGKGRPPADASVTLERFLKITVDALVRSATASRPHLKGRLPLHDRWLAALRTADGRVLGTPAELHALTAQIESWRRSALEEQATAHRLCLRVEEPETDDGPWRIGFLLQSRSDPSLLLDVKTIWAKPALRRELLASLGGAARISPQIEAALRQRGTLPPGFTLDIERAYAFLSETAWLLQQSGIGLILPAWWVAKNGRTRLVTQARVKRPATSAGLRIDSLLDVDWSVAVGDASLTARELERLAKLKVPLLRIRGQWVHVDRAELRAALERMKHGARQISLGEAARMQLDPRTPVQARGRVGSFLERLRTQRGFEELAPPGGLHATLRPYQLRGYSWLRFLTAAGFGACLADDMGLGKTIQSLALVLREWREAAGEPVLLVCPTSVIGNWVREAQRFTPELPVAVHHGGARSRGVRFEREAKRHALVITSYALLHRDTDLFESISWRGVVLDEAQNIKNAENKQARAARALRARYRIALTGTPVENHVGDLWSLMEFLNPGMLGSHASFKRDFLIPIQALRDPEAGDRLRRLTGPFVLRRLKSDPAIAVDLPVKNEMKVFCTLTREQASLYAAVLREYEGNIDDAEGIARRGKILAMISKLKQVCNHPAHFSKDRSAIAGRSGKLARLEEMLEEILDVGERALIFTQFAEMGELLTNRLAERFAREVLFLHGAVPKRRRDEMVERFSGEHGPAFFVLSLKAGGSGLNLTSANHVFHFDRWWNPAVENQATDRAFRIGQHKAVQVHKFVCAGTLEERIDALIEGKRAIAENIVGSGESWLTELSNHQLRDLVALSADAVEE